MLDSLTVEHGIRDFVYVGTSRWCRFGSLFSDFGKHFRDPIRGHVEANTRRNPKARGRRLNWIRNIHGALCFEILVSFVCFLWGEITVDANSWKDMRTHSQSSKGYANSGVSPRKKICECSSIGVSACSIHHRELVEQRYLYEPCILNRRSTHPFPNSTKDIMIFHLQNWISILSLFFTLWVLQCNPLQGNLTHTGLNFLADFYQTRCLKSQAIQTYSSWPSHRLFLVSTPIIHGKVLLGTKQLHRKPEVRRCIQAEVKIFIRFK